MGNIWGFASIATDIMRGAEWMRRRWVMTFGSRLINLLEPKKKKPSLNKDVRKHEKKWHQSVKERFDDIYAKEIYDRFDMQVGREVKRKCRKTKANIDMCVETNRKVKDILPGQEIDIEVCTYVHL
jgi:hypothetical protein